LVEDVHGNMFAGRVFFLKCRMFVQIAVVQIVYDPVDMFFQYLEINAHAQFVEFDCPDTDLDLPVMTVREFTGAGVIPQVVTSGKMGFYKNVNHEKSFIYEMSCFRARHRIKTCLQHAGR
jgi:hypothetical protein